MQIPKYCIYLVLILFYGITNAQNLILNGGFEEHGEQKCITCNTSFGQYPGLVYHWDNGGWGSWLCDKTFKQLSDDKKYRICPFEQLSPKEGKVMIAMDYTPSTNINYGSASTLISRTIEPMRVGYLYEVSFWLYIENTALADPDWAKHIGIALLPQNIEFHKLYGKKLLLPFLNIDTVRYAEWYQVKWRVRPLCTSQYLVIRVFSDNLWPISRSYAKSPYYIDNVMLTKVKEESIVPDSSIYYCSRYDLKTLGLTPKLDKEILLFENQSFDLTESHRQVLDTFALMVRNYPELVFELSGHTDNIGSDNLVLSQKRAQSVFQYLTEVSKLPAFRFITLSRGSKTPFRLNTTEEGRRLNRRVEIRQSELEPSNMFYRQALKANEAKQYAEVFSNLNKWLIKPYKTDKGRMILLFDPRFSELWKDKRWDTLTKKVRAEYKDYKYPLYSYVLDSLHYDELIVNQGLTYMGYQGGLNGLLGYIPDIDTVIFEMEALSEAVLQEKYDAHFKALLLILGKTGWPKKSEFGEYSCEAAFSMLLNAKNVVEYLRWLPEIQKACEEGEAPWMNYALLYDRCNRSLGKPQRYLTLISQLENGDLHIEPWEGDEHSINDWRAKIGLPLLPAPVVDAMNKHK